MDRQIFYNDYPSSHYPESSLILLPLSKLLVVIPRAWITLGITTTLLPLLYHYTTTSLYKSPQLRQDFMSSSFYNSPQSLAFLFQLSFSFFLFVDLKWRKFNKLCKYRIHCDLRVPLGKEVFQFLLLFSKQPRFRKVLTHNWRKVKVVLNAKSQ